METYFLLLLPSASIVKSETAFEVSSTALSINKSLCMYMRERGRERGREALRGFCVLSERGQGFQSIGGSNLGFFFFFRFNYFVFNYFHYLFFLLFFFSFFRGSNMHVFFILFKVHYSILPSSTKLVNFQPKQFRVQGSSHIEAL